MVSGGPRFFRSPSCFPVLLLLTALAASCVPMEAQSSRQIDPAAPTPLVGKPAATASDSDSPRSLPTRTKPVRVDVDVVEVPVVVTDPLNRAVVGLSKDCFTLLDGGNPQQIQFFAEEDSPMSIALVLDVSNSMTTKILDEGAALAEFLKSAHPSDDYFAIAVSDRPVLIAGAGADAETIQAKLGSIKPSGYTALNDSIYLAIHTLQHARYKRRAILVISDGGDNNSRYSLRQLKNVALESDVLIYAIHIVNSVPLLGTLEARFGNRLLSTIAQSTGGRSISLTASDTLPQTAAEISWELRHQYVLGYRPTQLPRDGKPHRIQVKVQRAPNERLQAHYRQSYRAPGN